MEWFKEVFSPNSEGLVIAFGSLYLGKNYDPDKFMWERMLSSLSTIKDFKRLYVHDLDIAWWQTKFEGLKGLGPHVVSEFLKAEVEKSKAKKVLAIGASMGGYAAILFTCLCRFDVAFAIAPQTYIDDFRYKRNKLTEKFSGLDINKEETDLKVVLEKYGNNYSKYNIYYGNRNKNDTGHAKRISHFPGVSLFPIESDKHAIDKIVRDAGITKDIILKFVS